MARRMTSTQRADRDFWLGAAERASTKVRRNAHYNLCDRAYVGTKEQRQRREALLALFTPARNTTMYWWDYDCRCDVCLRDGGVVHRGQDDASGRVLAACFLAAMCAAGDI